MPTYLGTFSARDKIIPRTVNDIARVECSMSVESRRNLLLCLLYMKKKASERRRKFTVMRRRSRRRRFEIFRKYEAVYTHNVVSLRERLMRVWGLIALQSDLLCNSKLLKECLPYRAVV